MIFCEVSAVVVTSHRCQDCEYKYIRDLALSLRPTCESVQGTFAFLQNVQAALSNCWATDHAARASFLRSFLTLFTELSTLLEFSQSAVFEALRETVTEVSSRAENAFELERDTRLRSFASILVLLLSSHCLDFPSFMTQFFSSMQDSLAEVKSQEESPSSSFSLRAQSFMKTIACNLTLIAILIKGKLESEESLYQCTGCGGLQVAFSCSDKNSSDEGFGEVSPPLILV